MGSLNIYSIYRSFQPGFREKRMRYFLDLFKPAPETTILDIGGNVYDWIHVPVASQITILNIAPEDSSPEYPARFHYVMGDGCALPFPDQSFDIVYSNSVIEHLGTIENQQRFAQEVRRVGRNVFIQTPNRWFPIEPHFIAFFFHFLPKRIQGWFLPRFSLRGMLRAKDNVALQSLFDELRLLSGGQMKMLFPDCMIHRERLFGWAKSLVAIRRK